MNRMRVVHIINDMDVGGAQRQVLNLFEAIDQTRFDMRCICLTQTGAFGERLVRQGFEVRALGKKRRIDVGMLRELVGILREWQPAIVHCHVFTANLWGRLAAVFAGVPIILSHEQSSVSLEKWHRRAVDRILAKKTHRVLAVSEDLRGRILEEEGLDVSRVKVLYNAIDCEAIEKQTREALPIVLPGNPGTRVAIVGRLEYRKDHVSLIRAAAIVRRDFPDVSFLIAGDGPLQSTLEEEIARLALDDTVHLLGTREDIPAILKTADLYCLSSITEGLSLSILEAMAAGCPVVATRVGGNPELLEDGKAGVLVSGGKPENLARAIVELLADPERAAVMAERAQKRARDIFDIRPVTRRLETLYLNAVD